MESSARLEARYQKWRKMGNVGIAEVIQRLWEPLACDDGAGRGARPGVGNRSGDGEIAVHPRNLRSRRGARAFCHHHWTTLLDPFALTDMPVAVDRILAAIANGERIAIHGDYDVDGITSTVILRRALELLGADVIHFIPERLRDGYGLQPRIARSTCRGKCSPRHLGGLRHPRCRGSRPRESAGAGSHHHRPSRA